MFKNYNKTEILIFIRNKVNKRMMQLSKAYTEALPDGATFDIIFVEGDEYRMGADKSTDPDAYDREAPIHTVRVPDFYLVKYPVTQALWLAVMGGENPSYFKGMDRPVEQVSWEDAQAFIKKLNRQDLSLTDGSGMGIRSAGRSAQRGI